MNVLITGCNSGFGFYTTEYFAAAGHHVYATVRETADTSRLEALASREGYSIELVTLEITDSDQILLVRDHVLSKGPLDVLVNNAGRVLITPFEETSNQQIRDIFEVNLLGLTNMIKAFLPSMRENRSGTIVNLSSPAAVMPTQWYGMYGASKAAVDALSKSLALEVADWNIRVILIYPGNFKTNILKNAAGVIDSVGEDSPYFELKKKVKEGYRAIYAKYLGGSEEERALRETGRPVGEAIFKAVTDGTLKMHYPVGNDAQGVWDSRFDPSLIR